MGEFWAERYEHLEPPNGPFVVMANDEIDADMAKIMSCLINNMWAQLHRWEIQILICGYIRPPYDPYGDFFRYCRYLRWQEFFRLRRENGST